MKSKIVQLTHRYPVLEYLFSVTVFFLTSLLFVLVLVVFFGLLSGR